ncbi:dihydrodipicolinate reductase [Emcibacter sp. SYSU 3D8]|uniref:NAD(P)H-dependent amine dehydrogenase family protein n=1 Tax=Emcibacter sp. SYSU 3D8 TaxID=3133969 RepID=UPI0031FEEBF3
MAYKVIQWSSGNVGKHAARAVAERADMKLVGMYVFSDAKAGQDAGKVAGIGKLGVKATNDAEKIVAMDADVVIHTALPSLVYGADPMADIDLFCRLLASGKDVITTVGYMYPKVYGPKLNKRLEEACRKGGSTFHSTGLNPGWLGDLLPMTMTALSRRVDKIYVREISNFQHYPSPEIMFDMMGFSKTPTQFKKDAERYSFWLSGLFRENIQMIADALGVKLDDIRESTVRELAATDLETASGTVRKGTVAGQHWTWAGVAGGNDVIVHETVWRIHESVAPEWPTGDHSVAIEGEPRMHVNFDAQWISDGLQGTAMHAVNAVPYVCDAPSGVKTFLDLPWIIGKGTVQVPKKAAKKKKKK